MNNENIENINKYINNIKEFDYYENFNNIKKIIYEFFLSLINSLYNGKYFIFYILITIIIIFYLLYYFVYDIISYKILFDKNDLSITKNNNDYNTPYDILYNNKSINNKEKYNYNSLISFNKYTQIFFIVISFITLSKFYFLVYRKIDSNKSNHNTVYNDITRNLIEIKNNQKSFSKINYEKTIKNPIDLLLKYLFLLIIILAIPVLIFVILFVSLNNFPSLYNILYYILAIFIILVLLAIIAYIFNIKNDSKTSNIYIDFIKKFIFFIPCLLVVLFEKLKNDLKLTPGIVYLMFIFEMILVTLLFILPSIYKYILNLYTNNLINEPIYLNYKTELGIYQDADKYNNEDNVISIYKDYINFYIKKNKFDHKYRDKYSLSFYLYIDPKSINNNFKEEVNILNYSNLPEIVFNTKKQHIIIYSQTQENKIIKRIKIAVINNFKYQKWLKFYINYNNNIIDIFLDNKLIESRKNVVPDFNDNTIIIGEVKGIYGSIKNVKYGDYNIPYDNLEFINNLVNK